MFKTIDKISNFGILQNLLQAPHLLELLDKMCKYEMDPANIVEVTEWTWFCPQTDGQMDRQTDRQMDGRHETSVHHFQLR